MANLKLQIPEAFSFLFQKARLKVAWGGRGAAKSESIGRYLLADGIKKPQNIVCGREFQTSIKDSVHSMLKHLISEMNIEREYNVLDTEIRGRNGSVFSFVGLHHNINNIKSMHNIGKFWGEEAQTFSKYSLDILFPTVRAEDSELIFSMNPELEDDPSYQMLIANPQPDSIIKKVNYYDNPYFPEVLRKEMEFMKLNNYQEYLHIWEGYCRQAVEGAVYSNEMRIATEQRRITNVPYDPTKPVSTFWDLGWGDYTSIWFAQCVGHEFKIIDFYQNQRQRTGHYAEIMQSKGYVYDRIFLPHDASNESINADRTTEQILIESFRNSSVFVLPNFPHAVKKGIQAARNVFPLCVFDKEKCADGLSALRHYHYKVDPDTKKVSKEPEHDSSSHAADAFRYLSMAITKDDPEESFSKKYAKSDTPKGTVAMNPVGNWDSGYDYGAGRDAYSD